MHKVSFVAFLLSIFVVFLFSTTALPEDTLQDFNPKPASASLYNLGLKSYENGDIPSAITYFKKAIELDPNFVDAYYNLGAIYKKEKDYSQAISAFQKAVDLNANDMEAIYELASCYFEEGDFAKAKKYFSLISTDFPKYNETQKKLESVNQYLASTPSTDSNVAQPSGYEQTQAQLLANKLGKLQENEKLQVQPLAESLTKPGEGAFKDPYKVVRSNFNGPTGIAKDSQGNIYIANFAKNSIERITQDGKREIFIEKLGIEGPVGIATDENDNLYIANYNGNSIAIVTPTRQVSLLTDKIVKPYYLFYDNPSKKLFATVQGNDSLVEIDTVNVVKHPITSRWHRQCARIIIAMKQLTVSPLSHPIKATISIPPDKSISHRAIIIGSISNGKTEIKNLSSSTDCLNTLKIMQQLGVEINNFNNFETVTIYGKGFRSFSESKNILNCGNSGTTIRLLSGLLSAQEFISILSGDESLLNRPMRRVIEPLTLMGAKIAGREHNTKAPVVILPSMLHGITYEMPQASAQVKSAIMLAALQAKGETKIIEKEKSRDHTERMLTTFGATIKQEKNEIIIGSEQRLEAQTIQIPGDISSAAFFMAASAIVGGSEIVLQRVLVNPTRTGIINVLKKMGVKVEITNKKEISGEPVADIFVSSSDLNSVEVKGSSIPVLIDELPILCVVMAQAKGKSIIKDARELRFKESDRIKTMVQVLKKLGVEVNELEDGLEIEGLAGEPFKVNPDLEWPNHFDHRIAMSIAIAALKADEPVSVPGVEWIETSFPNFDKLINQLSMAAV